MASSSVLSLLVLELLISVSIAYGVLMMPKADTFKVDTVSNMFVDQYGRTRFFHGLNFDRKSSPYVYDVSQEFLSNYTTSLGLNIVRLAIEWHAIEPARGKYNDTYLQEIVKLTQKLGQHGIYYFLDMHQDTWGPSLCGNGAPDWATILTKKQWKEFPIPVDLNMKTCELNEAGRPNCSTCPPMIGNWWGAKYFSIADCAAFGNFYDNVQGVQQAWADMWAYTAKVFASDPYLVGYELLNEPWMGDIYSDISLLTEKGRTDTKYLQPMYERAASAIRAIDDKHWIMFEASTRDTQLWALGSGFTQAPGGDMWNELNVFVTHIYCPISASPKSEVERIVCDDLYNVESFNVHLKDAKRLKSGYFLTEFGAVADNSFGMREIDKITRLADDHLVSWTYWDASQVVNDKGFQLHLARPYPTKVAADKSIKMPTEIFMSCEKWFPRASTSIHIIPSESATYVSDGNFLTLHLQPSTKTGDRITVEIIRA